MTERPNPGVCLQIAKSMAAGQTRIENWPTLTKVDFYAAIRRNAEDIRKSGESAEAARVRYMTQFEDGRALRQAHQLAKGPDWQPVPREPVAKAQRGTAGEEIDRRARALRVTQPAMSLAQARIHVRNQDPALKERERQEELAA